MNATLDTACTARLVKTLQDLNRRGVSTSLSAGSASTSTAQMRQTPRRNAWPTAIAEWERIVFRVGLLLSAAIAWVGYLQSKW
jgi:hypothetical protein